MRKMKREGRREDEKKVRKKKIEARLGQTVLIRPPPISCPEIFVLSSSISCILFNGLWDLRRLSSYTFPESAVKLALLS